MSAKKLSYFPPLQIVIFMHLFVCVRVHAAAGVRSEDNVKRFGSLSFGYGDRMQVLGFGGKHLYQLSHANGP